MKILLEKESHHKSQREMQKIDEQQSDGQCQV